MPWCLGSANPLIYPHIPHLTNSKALFPPPTHPWDMALAIPICQPPPPQGLSLADSDEAFLCDRMQRSTYPQTTQVVGRRKRSNTPQTQRTATRSEPFSASLGPPSPGRAAACW